MLFITGSDRSNMVGMQLLTHNYPYEELGKGFADHMEVVWQCDEEKSNNAMTT